MKSKARLSLRVLLGLSLGWMNIFYVMGEGSIGSVDNTNVTPTSFNKTIETPGFPSIEKEVNGKTSVKGSYFLKGKYVKFTGGVIARGKPGTITAGEGIIVGESLVLGETETPDEYGWLTVARRDAKPIAVHVQKDWIGGNLKPSTLEGGDPNISAHRLNITSRWNKLDQDTETNTGLDSDLVTIGGNVYGYTEVVSTVTDSTIEEHAGKTYMALSHQAVGGKIVPGAPLITVKGASQYENSFFGSLPIANGKVVQLVPYDNGKAGDENVHGYTWGWAATKGNSLASNVPGVLLLPMVNRSYAQCFMGSLQERLGESDRNLENSDIWVRYMGKQETQESKGGLGFRSSSHGVQMGYRVRSVQEKAQQSHIDLVLGALEGRTHFTDAYHVEFNTARGDYADVHKEVAQGRTHLYAIGITSTKYQGHREWYQDWVAQYIWGRSTQWAYGEGEKDKSKLHGLAFSYELGKTLYRSKKWTLEGQGQLMYLRLQSPDYTSINQMQVHPGIDKSLVGRLGLRYYANVDSQKFMEYVTLDLYHDFYPASITQIGDTFYRPSMARTWLAVGLGGEKQLSNTTYLYGDVRYEHDMEHGAKLRGWRSNLGLKMKF